MASIGGLLGTAGGVSGTGIEGPGQATIYNPTNPQQIQTAYSGTQNSMQQQQNLLNALQGQNGIQNQSNVYNQLQGVVNGTGPNPAQAQLAQATGANTANQAALMAGQRGSSANAGLIARQAAMQGAANQQNSIGQAASLQAQQSLNALGQAGGVAGTQVANQVGQTNANTQANQAEQQALINAQLGVNNANVGSQSSVNAFNAGLANTQLQGQQAMVGGIMNNLGGGALSSMLAEGGEVKNYDQGGSVSGPQSSFGQFINTVNSNESPIEMSQPQFSSNNPGAAALEKGASGAGGGSGGGSGGGGGIMGLLALAAEGGKVPAMVSPGEQYLKPQDVKKVKQGANPLQTGERIPGKPKHPGNDYRNDVVRKDLDEGGIVIPNKIMQSKNPAKEAQKFVAATLAKHKHKSK